VNYCISSEHKTSDPVQRNGKILISWNEIGHLEM
jgi:hypothetical protein